VTKKPWFKFFPTDWRADKELRLCSYTARALWIELLGLMHEAEPYGHLLIGGQIPTPKELSKVVGMSPKSITKALPELIQKRVCSVTEGGVIFSRKMVRDFAKHQQGQEHGSQGGNPTLKGGVNPPDNAHIPEARIQKLELEKKEKNPPPEAAGMPPHSREGSKQESAAAAPPGFAEFWLAYPKKVSKPAALRAFKQAIKRVELEPMLTALNAQKKKWNPEFIKNPATWLNNDCWDDEVVKQPEWSSVL